MDVEGIGVRSDGASDNLVGSWVVLSAGGPPPMFDLVLAFAAVLGMMAASVTFRPLLAARRVPTGTRCR